MSLETREIKLFGRDIPGFGWDIPAVPKKFEKNNCVQFWPLSHTILTQMMADEFNFLWSEIQNYIAEADADLIPVPENYMVDADMVSCCLHALVLSLFVADLKMEELELHYRCRGRIYENLE